MGTLQATRAPHDDADAGRSGTGTRPPLAGIRVLDCATIIAAPYCAMLLADFGAEVVKVEHPSGDGLRTSGAEKNGVGLSNAYYNRNKRGIVVDLALPEGQALLRELAANADVLIENFRPGTMERWGLGWEVLHALNPRLVMLRMSGFGQFGPYAQRPGFGTLAESMCGFAHVNGHPDGPPTLPPFGLADGVAGLAAAYAVMLALFNRDGRRGASREGGCEGEGQMIDVAIIEPLLHVMGAQVSGYDQLGQVPGRTGNRTPHTAPRNVYRTRDERWVAVSASSQAIAERLMRLVGRPEVIEEPWFASGPGRAAHADELDRAVGRWIVARTQAEVIAAFEGAEAAVAPIQDVAQVCTDPQYAALGSIASVPDPVLGPVRMQNLLFRMQATPGAVRHTGPQLGQHTDEVLREWLALGEARRRALAAAGVTTPRPKRAKPPGPSAASTGDPGGPDT